MVTMDYKHGLHQFSRDDVVHCSHRFRRIIKIASHIKKKNEREFEIWRQKKISLIEESSVDLNMKLKKTEFKKKK